MWLPRDIRIRQNEQFSKPWYFYNPDAVGVYLTQGGDNNLVPRDFTGATLKLEVRQTEQSTSTLLDTYGTATGEMVLAGSGIQNFPSANPPAVPAYNNGYILTIPGARSLSLPSGVYFFDVLITVAGINDYIMGGRFTVEATQTR
jgi:hypothetical protein